MAASPRVHSRYLAPATRARARTHAPEDCATEPGLITDKAATLGVGRIAWEVVRPRAQHKLERGVEVADARRVFGVVAWVFGLVETKFESN